MTVCPHSTRCAQAFIEGEPVYQDAGFREKNHIQLCVRNPACIKGYFRPLDDNGRPSAFD